MWERVQRLLDYLDEVFPLQRARSLRVAVIIFAVIALFVIVFLVVFVLLILFVNFVVWLLSKEEVVSERSEGSDLGHSGRILLMSNGTLRILGNVATAVQSTGRTQRRAVMAQKIIEVVGTSNESFAKAAENAVAEAAKTVRGLKWARVAHLEMELDGKKIAQYRATTKIFFDIEQ